MNNYKIKCYYCHGFFIPKCDCIQEPKSQNNKITIFCSECYGTYCDDCKQYQLSNVRQQRQCIQCHQYNNKILFHDHSHGLDSCYYCSLLNDNLCNNCINQNRFDMPMKELVDLLTNINKDAPLLFKFYHRGNLFQIPIPCQQLQQYSHMHPLPDYWHCLKCEDIYCIVLAEHLFDYGCITKSFYQEPIHNSFGTSLRSWTGWIPRVYDLCPKCFIDYLVEPSEKSNLIWKLWDEFSYYIQWLPEEVLFEITDFVNRKWKPIGTLFIPKP